ncbi:hypothetical protein OIU34_21580 [Pararhizobium sp. BT-229]|uniref:hypothetical protein n=1 Tax=Pararhizobium sp. BT-229 TaxID=2986923 RepID=UPI0021F7A7A7|nr:hypothetical protein [Pararhizobium sp. BT-229]MCV9964485.1 hypothetical protein [Pararhizobium sp. BT-229]
MKFTAAFKRFIFGDGPPPPKYPRWPECGEIETWMRGKIAHYRAHHPDQAYHLFDLSCGDYLPNTVHVAGNFGPAELAIYRRLKSENYDLVEQARQSTGHRFCRSRIYDPEDWPTEGMLG